MSCSFTILTPSSGTATTGVRFVAVPDVPETGAAVATAGTGLMETLEDCDDVQNVYANFDVSDEDMAALG